MQRAPAVASDAAAHLLLVADSGNGAGRVSWDDRATVTACWSVAYTESDLEGHPTAVVWGGQ